VCDAVEARLLQASDVATLRSLAERAESEGADAIFFSDGPLGDAIVLAAGISASTSRILLGVRVELTAEAHRHPTVLAREMTTLDHVCGGRSVLGFRGPFTDAVGEAISLCRAMWIDGVAASEGPHYPVAGAINRPRPPGPESPLIALDLTDAGAAGAPPEIVAQVDFLLRPTGDPDVCLLQRA
jgi:alkanesulfonate monooxygenase SsuD/methylene tetrahydromethanopterin reductase-like flavin-dependent oxidoreductase (luciferase family)